MKELKFNLVTLLLLLLSIGIYAQEQIEKKITKEFDVSDEIEFRISHKFGDIKVEDWTESRIVVEYTLIADTKKQEKAEKLFSRVDIETMQTKEAVQLRTVYEKKIDKKDLRVDVLIRMPQQQKITLLNKFGDVFINELSSPVDIEIAYGSLKAKTLSYKEKEPMNHIRLSYGNADIDTCNWLRLATKYSNIEISKVNAIFLDSRYSNVEFDQCNSFVSDSKYDNFELGSARNIVVQSKFSNYEIGSIAKKIDLQFEYGNFEVGHVQANFESIDITNKYGEIEIEIDENASYYIDADVKYCDLDIPSENSVNHHVDGSQEYYKGLVGKDKSTKSKVKIYSKYGGVELD